MTKAAPIGDDAAITELLELLNSALEQTDNLGEHLVAIHINDAIEALKATNPCR